MKRRLLALRPFILSAVLALAVGPSLAHAASLPRIEKIESGSTPRGQKPAILLQKGLNVREAGVGDEVRPTERVRTDTQTSVKLLYPDGSRVDVGPGSDLEIEKAKRGIQASVLHGGYVQGEVQKSTGVVVGSKPKIHFLVRTKAAVMGVRGTQFVAAFDALKEVAEFHTLQGTVEVAQSAEALTAASGAGGTSVAGGQFVAATASGGITGVQSFGVPAFLSSLTSTAGLQTVAASAPSSVGTGAASSVMSSAASKGLSGAVSAVANRNQSAPPATPPPALAPPPPPPKSPEQEAKEKLAQEEEDKNAPRIHPFNFQIGFVYAEEPNPPGTVKVRHRALHLAYTPYIPLPISFLKWIYVRPFLGFLLWDNGSLYNGVLTREAQLFVGVSLLRPLFVELGAGIQNWAKLGRNAKQLSLNAGLILNENKFFNRLFIGATGAHFGDRNGSQEDAQWVGEIRVGLGFQF